ncbi:MAG: D-glycero-beta-D-manno-heptose-7-phosphate kinase [Burkholderiaceae bacterium]
MTERVDFSPARILVVGDAMLDRYWFGDVDRISPEAPVPVVRVRQFEERLGGAANVARNVASLGARATLVAIVGKDEPGDLLERMARGLGVQTRLARDARLPTTIKLRVIGRQQQLLRIDFEETPAPEALASKLEAVRGAVGDCDVMVLSDYGKGGLAQVDRMLAMAREAGRAVVVDPKGEDFDRYRGASVLTPNRAELRAVVGGWHGEEDLAAKAHALRERLDIDSLLLTRSEEGMSLFSRDGSSHHVAARTREVYDVSGAGDTVVATLATALAVGCPIELAVRLANTAGGIVVGKLGTADVSPEELFGS